MMKNDKSFLIMAEDEWTCEIYIGGTVLFSHRGSFASCVEYKTYILSE